MTPTKPKTVLVGEVFGQLTVLDPGNPRLPKHSRKTVCKCTCGKSTSPTVAELHSKRHTRSCGCLCIASRACFEGKGLV